MTYSCFVKDVNNNKTKLELYKEALNKMTSLCINLSTDTTMVVPTNLSITILKNNNIPIIALKWDNVSY